MRQYELLVVFKPNNDSEEIETLVSKLSADIESFGGKVDKLDKMGRKKLAYDIQNFRDGFFANLLISLPEDKVVEMKRQLRLNDSILRTMFLAVEAVQEV